MLIRGLEESSKGETSSNLFLVVFGDIGVSGKLSTAFSVELFFAVFGFAALKNPMMFPSMVADGNGGALTDRAITCFLGVDGETPQMLSSPSLLFCFILFIYYSPIFNSN